MAVHDGGRLMADRPTELDGFLTLAAGTTFGIDRPPMPSEPPAIQVLSQNRSVYETTRAEAIEYYQKALMAWWSWRGGHALGQKFGERDLERLRVDFAHFLSEMVDRGFARGGLLPWRTIAEFSLDFCIVAIDRDDRPIRSPYQVGLDIEPLSLRLADYWMGVR